MNWSLVEINNKNNKSKVNNYLSAKISISAYAILGEVTSKRAKLNVEESRTDLDSHANMPCMGKNALIITDTGKVIPVNAFTPDYEAMDVKIVDVALKYECPFTGMVYILLVKNALSVPSMQHNLIPPFMLREAGIMVNDTPKIHVINPTVRDHAITFTDGRPDAIDGSNVPFRIPLGLWGVFSYFPTSAPSIEEFEASENVYTHLGRK